MENLIIAVLFASKKPQVRVRHFSILNAFYLANDHITVPNVGLIFKFTLNGLNIQAAVLRVVKELQQEQEHVLEGSVHVQLKLT